MENTTVLTQEESILKFIKETLIEYERWVRETKDTKYKRKP